MDYELEYKRLKANEKELLFVIRVLRSENKDCSEMILAQAERINLLEMKIGIKHEA